MGLCWRDLWRPGGLALAGLLLVGCGGGMEIGGGGPPDPSSAVLADEDPMDDDVINEGTGDVIE